MGHLAGMPTIPFTSLFVRLDFTRLTCNGGSQSDTDWNVYTFQPLWALYGITWWNSIKILMVLMPNKTKYYGLLTMVPLWYHHV